MSIQAWNPENYLRAARFASEAHAHQQVKNSIANYALHLASVSMEILYAWRGVPDFDVDLALSVAWLHDILEDTEVSAEAIQQGFGDRVLLCVRALTKDETVPMEERIADVLRRLPSVPREAGLVKMADRITNLQPPPSFWTTEKCREYCREAEQILTALSSQHPVLRERLSRKIEDYRQFCGEI